MDKDRLLAFSDGVIAVIITIMVLELKVPEGAELVDLGKVWPTFFCYVLSFVNVAIYWNNHHHVMHLLNRVNGSILWANMHLLFWLSLIPFTTEWMGANHFAPIPTAIFGVALLLPAIAYLILTLTIIHVEGPTSPLARALGRDVKGKLSIAVYAVAIPVAIVRPWAACFLYLLMALIWLVPDRRIERQVNQHQREP